MSMLAWATSSPALSQVRHSALPCAVLPAENGHIKHHMRSSGMLAHMHQLLNRNPALQRDFVNRGNPGPALRQPHAPA